MKLGEYAYIEQFLHACIRSGNFGVFFLNHSQRILRVNVVHFLCHKYLLLIINYGFGVVNIEYTDLLDGQLIPKITSGFWTNFCSF
jgi:hypothetical protein